MELVNLFVNVALMSSPLTVGLLVATATLLLWQGFAPASALGVAERTQDYLDRGDLLRRVELEQPLRTRVLVPLLRRLLRLLGGFMPKRNLEKTARSLILAGEPGGLTVLDFLGLRLLLALLLGGGYYFLAGGAEQPFFVGLRNGMGIAVLGLSLPHFWLRRRARHRQHQIARALPDALDMLTIGVQAGLAFESALLRVGEQWRTPLSDEFRRTVREMRIGTPRNEALRRLVERSDVEELATFVAILVQSNQLGVSISQVLQGQAEQMRIKRRQRAEELARQAGVKIVIVLVIFIFPVMMIVTLGPAVPRVAELFNAMTGG